MAGLHCWSARCPPRLPHPGHRQPALLTTPVRHSGVSFSGVSEPRKNLKRLWGSGTGSELPQVTMQVVRRPCQWDSKARSFPTAPLPLCGQAALS